MAEVDFRTIMIQAILVSIFFLAMVTFVYQFGLDQGATTTILNDTSFNSTLSAMKTNLVSTQGNVTNQSQNQDKGETVAIFEFLSKAIVGTVKVFKGLFTDVYNLTFGLVIDTLGVNEYVLYGLSSILGITLIFYGWRAWKRG